MPQVTTHCEERGRLLSDVWLGYTAMVDRHVRARAWEAVWQRATCLAAAASSGCMRCTSGWFTTTRHPLRARPLPACSVLSRVHQQYQAMKDRAERAEVKLEMAEAEVKQERESGEAYKVRRRRGRVLAAECAAE